MRKFFLFSLLLIAGLEVFPGDYQLFRSNALGMTLEAIPEFRRRDYPWVLERELLHSGDSRRDIRRLYNEEGLEEKAWEIEYFRDERIREKETIGGLTEESFFERGLMTRQIISSAGETSEAGETPKEPEIREYSYSGRVLKAVSYRRGDEFLYRDEYLIDAAGRLLRINRSFDQGGQETPADNPRAAVNYMFGRDRLLRERYWDGTREQIFLFDESYRTSREDREGEELLRSERWYVQDGVRYRLETFPREDREILSQYDQEDRLVKEEITRGGASETIDYRWDGRLMAEKNRRLPGLREQWLYEYEGDRLIKEEKYVNRQLSLVIHYPETGRRREEIYRNGTLLAVVDYENDRPVETRIPGTEKDGLTGSGDITGAKNGSAVFPEAGN